MAKSLPREEVNSFNAEERARVAKRNQELLRTIHYALKLPLLNYSGSLSKLVDIAHSLKLVLVVFAKDLGYSLEADDIFVGIQTSPDNTNLSFQIEPRSHSAKLFVKDLEEQLAWLEIADVNS